MAHAAAAIQFALETEDGLEFLRLWNEGAFDVLRKERSEAQEEVYIGADLLYTAIKKAAHRAAFFNG
ncbi:hypothetical protein AB6D66_00520 [Vibrio pomeroyi]|uniref:Uncharacterized protein n=1 Tax=Vibrio pomeroyi TaxID=198832 RepID=A0ABV4MQV4_9VIBR|nr:hypothetical protein [Vibrio atlanticus]MCZ4311033.1 hypothetical protein [Vibrio atlanticus]